MTQQKAEKIARDLLLLFDLSDYRVRIVLESVEGCEMDDGIIVGETRRRPERLEAQVRLATKRTDADIEETIRHEVCGHMVLGPLRDAHKITASELSPQARTLAERAFAEAEEQATTRICRAVARLKGERTPGLA